eukprot:IDg2549t1
MQTIYRASCAATNIRFLLHSSPCLQTAATSSATLTVFGSSHRSPTTPPAKTATAAVVRPRERDVLHPLTFLHQPQHIQFNEPPEYLIFFV